MNLEDALESDERLTLAEARRELRRHHCEIIASRGTATGSMPTAYPTHVYVSNGHDPAEWVECTPAAILAWLGY